MHFLLKTEDFVQNRLPILHFWLRKKVYSEQNLVDFRRSCGPKPGFSIVAAFFFDPSERNKVQEHFKITTQLIFLMPPTSPASFVQIGALWIFFVPRVPPLHHFSFLVAQTPTRCKQTSKSLPSLFFWWSPPVLQVSSRLEHFEFFLFQGSPLWIISEISIKCKKVAFFVFRDTDPIFWLNTQDCPRNNSRAFPQMSPRYLRRNPHFDARDFVCAPATASLLLENILRFILLLHKIDIFELWTFKMIIAIMPPLWKLRRRFVYSSTVSQGVAISGAAVGCWVWLWNLSNFYKKWRRHKQTPYLNLFAHFPQSCLFYNYSVPHLNTLSRKLTIILIKQAGLWEMCKKI